MLSPFFCDITTMFGSCLTNIVKLIQVKPCLKCNLRNLWSVCLQVRGPSSCPPSSVIAVKYLQHANGTFVSAFCLCMHRIIEWISSRRHKRYLLLYYYNRFMAPWTVSGTTCVNRHQKAKTNLDLLEQELVSGSGISWSICKSAPCPRQITTPAPHYSVFYRPDAVPAAHPTASKHLLKTFCFYFHYQYGY